MSEQAEWFLTSSERGNPSWDLPAWSEGDEAEALIDGASYFDRLVTQVEALREGDHLFNPLTWLRDRFQGTDAARRPLPEQPPDPPPCGSDAVQVPRTYGDALIEYEFAKDGERSIARGYTKAVRRARRRLRPHKIERVDPCTRLWAEPAYRMIYDPDGRSYRDRLMGRRP
ncbi:MAG TPA: hypothetical protein VJ777_30195 [Mycobacterium sp.]|nr:hypothetical protein [Mycobacterium sp.]